MGSKKKATKKAAKKVAVKAKAAKTPKALKTPKSKTPKKRTSEPKSGQSGPPLDLKKADMNEKEKKILSILASDLNPMPINALATTCFPDAPASKANSWVRNSLRRTARAKWVEKVGKGTYRLPEEARAKWDSVEDIAAEVPSEAASESVAEEQAAQTA
jgi:hypothetical protein